MADKKLRAAFKFHLAHGGHIVGRHAESALAAARAELAAQGRDWEFFWEPDDFADLGDHAYWCADERRENAGYTRDGEWVGDRHVEYHGGSKYGGHEHNVEWCQLREPEPDGRVIASLGGIIDPDRNYRRVVEAELAMEALSYERDETEQVLAFIGRAFGLAS